MNRTLLFIALLVLACTIQSGPANANGSPESAECVRCHRQIYNNALASPYQHTVAINTCTECHVTGNTDDNGPEEKQEENYDAVHFSTYQMEGALFLEDLQEAQPHEFEIVAADRAGRESTSYQFTIVPGTAEERTGDLPVLTRLFDVTVAEIKKGVFVEAAITWMTDVPATSEVEYKLFNRRESRFVLENEFSRKHRVTLNALAHDQYYFYKVISRDMLGNVLESEEEVFDTSDEVSTRNRHETENPAGPVIEEVTPFRIKGQKGMYVKIHTNKPSRFIVSYREMPSKEIKVPKQGRNHPSALAPARYAAIEACIKCHNQNASHPVGVRAQNEKVRTPEDLPTIDGGVVTCVSCHFPHGGKKLYFARTGFKKDLCIKCHTGYY